MSPKTNMTATNEISARILMIMIQNINNGVVFKNTDLLPVKFVQFANLSAVLDQIRGKLLSCKFKLICEFQMERGTVLRKVVALAQFLEKLASVLLSD